MKVKNYLLQFHIYLGLFCTPYLLVFAISSLSFNHVSLREAFTPIKSEKVSVAMRQDSFKDPRALGEALRDSLHLMGWFIPWESHIDSAGFLVNVRNLGRDFRMTGTWGIPEIELTTNSTRFISKLKGLHGLHEEIPGAPWWINGWWLYQDLTVYSLLFWALSGIYLWWISKSRSKYSAFWLLGSFAVSTLLMIYLWLAG
ncbi:MAG: hypothetical protein RIE59_10935 [Imperialibacter sp.]